MKKIKILFIGICLLINSCGISTVEHKHNKDAIVNCYQQHLSTGEILFWYMLLAPNGNTYYYNSSTQITNYSNITWNDNAPINFNSSEFTQVSSESVESNGFSEDMQNEAFESTESNGFEDENNSSDNLDNGDSYNSDSESDGFDSGGDGGGE